MKTRIDLESFPALMREDVQRVARLLEEELTELSDFEIEAYWRYGADRQGRPCPLLDLTTPYTTSRFGVVDYPYTDNLFTSSDLAARRQLSGQIWCFTRNLSELIRNDLKQLRKGLAEMAPVGGE